MACWTVYLTIVADDDLNEYEVKVRAIWLPWVIQRSISSTVRWHVSSCDSIKKMYILCTVLLVQKGLRTVNLAPVSKYSNNLLIARMFQFICSHFYIDCLRSNLFSWHKYQYKSRKSTSLYDIVESNEGESSAMQPVLSIQTKWHYVRNFDKFLFYFDTMKK